MHKLDIVTPNHRLSQYDRVLTGALGLAELSFALDALGL
jgi:hypothetical protein